jgi:quinol monooxygenase YgiN
MPILLKIRWDIAEGREPEFRDNQKKLCAVMRADHPGVICYHVDYPAPNVSEWTEIYANDDAFRAHLANERGKAPLAAVSGRRITTRPRRRSSCTPGRIGHRRFEAKRGAAIARSDLNVVAISVEGLASPAGFEPASLP